MLESNTQIQGSFRVIGTNIIAGVIRGAGDAQSIKAIREGILEPANPADQIAGLHGEAVYVSQASTKSQEIVAMGQGSLTLNRATASSTAQINAVLVRVHGYSDDPDSPQRPTGTAGYGLPETRQPYVYAGSGVEVYLPISNELMDATSLDADILYDVANKVFTIGTAGAGILPTPFKMIGSAIKGTRPWSDNDPLLPVQYVSCNLAIFKI